MPKRPKSAVKPPRVPSYCLHKATGQAYIKIRGRMVYLGLHGSPSSRDAYAAAVADLLAGREVIVPAADRDAEPQVDNRLTVAQLCQKYCRYAEGYYVKNGRPTGEAKTVAGACDHAVALFGEQPAESFGPLALKTVRERLVAAGLARTTVNGTIGRIRRAFTWGAGEELIPASVPVALGMVAGLRAGRSAAREPVPVRPVADTVVEATLPHLPVVVADMVRLARLTGMRPGELCELRPGPLARYLDLPPRVAQDRASRSRPRRLPRRSVPSHSAEVPGPRRQVALLPPGGQRSQTPRGRHRRPRDTAVVRRPSRHQSQGRPAASPRRELQRR